MILFAPHIEAMFSVLGRPAAYILDGGTPIEIRVIPKRPDEIEEINGMQIVAATNVFDVRRSEISQPKKGDELTFEGETYIIIGEPVSRDPDRLIWTLSAAEE